MEHQLTNVNGVDFCETPTARKIFHVLTVSADSPDVGIGLIVGNAGVGKTTALRAFAARRHFPICTMNKATGSMSAAMAALCTALGSMPSRTVRETYEIIVNQIQWRKPVEGDSFLVIIDEAQHLNDAVIDQLRSIWDETGVGMALCGNAEFKNRFNRADAAAFAQVTSRIGMRVDIPSTDEEDVDAIAQARGIEGAMERRFILKYGLGIGGLRTVTKLINIALTLPDPGAPVNLPHLKAAAGLLGLDR